MSKNKICALILLAAFSLCQLHAENKVRSVDVKARLDSLGNASIRETWSVSINSSNTEWYLSLANLGNGCIVAESDGPLAKDDGIIVMAAFDKSLFNSGNSSSDSFSVMKELAFKDSDYITDDDLSFLEGLLIIVILILAVVACLVFFYMAEVVGALGLTLVVAVIIPLFWATITLFPLRMYIKRSRLLRHKPYTREIPEDKDLTRVPYILDKYSYNILSTPESWNNKITAAYLMRLIAEDAIYIDRNARDKGKVKPMFHVRSGWTLEPGKYSEADSDAMKSLYKIIKGASGEDLILQEGELKAYKKKEGLEQVRAYYKKRKIGDFKLDKEEAVRILGLQAFLNDFTISEDRDIPEMALWNEYLVYATAFGIADRVLKSMRQTAPDYPLLDKVCDESGAFLLSGAIMDDVFHGINHLQREASPKKTSSGSNSYGGYSSRSSGGGGRSSHSGGHGHSGGGGGGGR